MFKGLNQVRSTCAFTDKTLIYKWHSLQQRYWSNYTQFWSIKRSWIKTILVEW